MGRTNTPRMSAEETIDYNRRIQDEDLQRKIVSDRFKQHQAAIAAGMPRSMLPSVDSLNDMSPQDWLATEQRINRHLAAGPAVAPSGVGMLTNEEGGQPKPPPVAAPLAALPLDPASATAAGAVNAAVAAVQPPPAAVAPSSFSGLQSARMTGAGVVATDPETGRRVAVTPNAQQAMSLKTGGAWDNMTRDQRTEYLRNNPASQPQGRVVPNSMSNGELPPLTKAESRAIEVKYAPHVVDPMYSGGVPTPVAGHVRELPRDAPGYINGKQVDGLPQPATAPVTAPMIPVVDPSGAANMAQSVAAGAVNAIPASPARVRAAKDAAAGEAAKNNPAVATTPTTTGTAATIAQPVTPTSPANAFGLGARNAYVAAGSAAVGAGRAVAGAVDRNVVQPVTDVIAGISGRPGVKRPPAPPAAAGAPPYMPDVMTGADEIAAANQVGARFRTPATAPSAPRPVVAPTPPAIPPPPVASAPTSLPTPSAGTATPAQTPLGVVNEQAAGFTKPTAENPLPGTPTTPVTNIDETPEARKRKASMFPSSAQRAGKFLFGGF